MRATGYLKKRFNASPVVNGAQIKSNQQQVRQFTSTKTAYKAPDMFCFQCEQTENQTGCKTKGVCGKTPEVAGLQDLLIQRTIGISQYMSRAQKLGATCTEIDQFVLVTLFSTLTNVNFDSDRFVAYLNQQRIYLEKAKKLYEDAAAKAGVAVEKLNNTYVNPGPTGLDVNALVALSKNDTSILARKESEGADVTGVKEMIVYGIKGLAAYAEHAELLGYRDPTIATAIYEILNTVADPKADLGTLLGAALKVGEVNLTVMALLDKANTTTYGHPEPTNVLWSGIKGKAVLVSGHDLHILEAVLKQTEGKNVNVYTHGELLPANTYPQLKKYKHLIGNYGGAWQNQKIDFACFPGPIVMTSNCLIEPMKKYKNRIYTSTVTGWPGVTHLGNLDFTQVVKQAQEMEGFDEDEPEKRTMAGFGHATVMSVADKVIDAVKTGAIKHFFLIGGCDGSETERSYYTSIADLSPPDSIILTLGCAKYRLNTKDRGSIGGIPRLLDVGQCNDSYSAIQIAVALSKAFGCGVNDLPLSYVVSWFEQKAVAVLLTLLHLGITRIHLGPNLPGFITPNVLAVLQEKFQIRGVGEPNDDFRKMYAPKENSC